MNQQVHRGLAQSQEFLARFQAEIPWERVLLVGDHALERDWMLAGRLAGFLPAERYFGR